MSPRTDLSAVGGDTTPDGFTISILFGKSHRGAPRSGATEGFDGSFGSLSQERLQFRKGHLDRVQVGRVARQETQFGASASIAFHFRALVRGEIVDQDDVSFRERWSKHFFDISEETFAIDRAVEEGGGDAIMAKRGHESRRLRMPCGTLA
jgi:hypothetical protein